MSHENERVALLVSGDLASGTGGSTADKVTRDSLEMDLGFDVDLVVCSNPPGRVEVYDRFDEINEEYGSSIKVVHIGPGNYPPVGNEGRGQTIAESFALHSRLTADGIGFVSMLGYLRIARGKFIDEWGWHQEYGESDPTHNGRYHPNARILNNHPSILPFTQDTFGSNAHQAATDMYRAGRLTHTAMSWHLAGADVDRAPIIHEEPVEIDDMDDAEKLGGKVQAREKAFTAHVISRHIIIRRQHLLNAK